MSEGEDPKRYSRSQPLPNEAQHVVDAFVATIQLKIDKKLLRAPRGKEGDMMKKAVLYPGFYIGCAVGLAQFALLRKGPVLMMNHLKGNSSAPFQESTKIKPFSLLFDAILSTAMAGTVWQLCVDKEKVYETASTIPLIEGQSDISDALCSDFIDQHKSVRPEMWKENANNASLQAINDFVQNCKRRQAFEKRIRRDSGLGPSDPVLIPPPGVPENFIDDETGMQIGEATWGSAGQFIEETNDNNESFWIGK